MIKKLLLIVLLFSPLILSQTFHSLDGVEDQQGNTHLIYRLGEQGFRYSPVYKYDVIAGTETFIMDAHYYQLPGGENAKAVLDFEFFSNDSENFMNVGYTVYPDNHSYIARNDTVVFSGMGGYYRVDISKQNPLKVFAFVGDAIRRSFDGGFTFPEDSILLQTDYEFFNLTEYDDNIFFGYDFEYRFVKGGALVDTSKIFFDDYTKILYDVNQFHVYRVNKTYGGYAFYVSNNKGDAFTWTKTYQSENPLFITIDPVQSGIVYLSDGKKIYKSTNNGYSFTLYKTLISKIIGIYKKPGNEILYTATPYVIYKITPSEITIVKSLPVTPDLFEWFPLAVRNKWIYNCYSISYTGGGPPVYEFLGNRTMEVTRDTIINTKPYFILENDLGNQLVFEQKMFLRIDSITGSIFRYWETLSQDFPYYNLNADIGDTIYNPMNQGQPYYIFQDEIQSQFWDTLHTIRFYLEYAPCTCQHTLVKGLGLGSTLFNEFGGGEDLLKGVIINGVVYGDTSLVVSVDDEPDKIPTEFKLEQNYPNPFNPSTKINWQSPIGSHQTLKVYDVLGREVATLVNEYRDAGSYEVEFDGSPLASGVYYYQLRTENYSETKKMILIK